MKRRIITEPSGSADRVFGSSAFADVIFSRGRDNKAASEKSAKQLAAGDIVIRVQAPSVQPSQTLRIAGGCEALGCWNPDLAPELDDAAFPEWSITLPAESVPERFEYKFIVADRADGRLLAWEEGWNRRFDHGRPVGDEVLEVEVSPFFNPLRWRGAGTAIPVFSLRSERSCGVGEFRDLKLMADWAAATGQHVIQILPVNDTTCHGTWRDSYPYNANSIFALHPQYISLDEAGILRDGRRMRRFERARRELNALPEIDYERVNVLKHEYMYLLYKEQGAVLFSTDDYRMFFEANGSWLKPYAAYSVLRDSFGTSDFSHWGEYAEYDTRKIDEFIVGNAEAVGYWYFVQYHLDRQLRDASNYARSRGVILKGDIPIGINLTSVEAWSEPELFRMEFSAGAPPDDFAVKGQNWGFPTYNWERMAEDGYAWWRARFVKMSDYFDAYRIDHILGFFRIWEIPRRAVNALLGHFNPAMPLTADEIAAYGFRFNKARHTASVGRTDNVLFVADSERKKSWHPRIAAHSTACYKSLSEADREAFDRLYEDFFFRRHNDFWREGAMSKLLPLVESTRMLVCGEDLGMIPACVPDVMRELQILSLEIERMPKEWGAEFGTPQRYPYMSVCSPSSHDMSGLRLWWTEEPERAARYWRDVMGCEGDVPAECPPEVCERMLRRQLAAGSILTIVPLQEWLAMDGSLRRDDPAAERINVPANANQYWRYRMHIALEDLLAADGFNARLRAMIETAGR